MVKRNTKLRRKTSKTLILRRKTNKTSKSLRKIRKTSKSLRKISKNRKTSRMRKQNVMRGGSNNNGLDLNTLFRQNNTNDVDLNTLVSEKEAAKAKEEKYATKMLKEKMGDSDYNEWFSSVSKILVIKRRQALYKKVREVYNLTRR